MKRIAIREIDRFTSQMHEGRIISEYIIYLYQNDVTLACYTEIGNEAKNIRVNEMILESPISEPIEQITPISSKRLRAIRIEEIEW